jgi:hypothetical protein
MPVDVFPVPALPCALALSGESISAAITTIAFITSLLRI